MSYHEAEFWRSTHRYHGLAERFERGIEVVHPKVVSGRHMACPICTHCAWCASKVTYYEYRGPRNL